MTEPSEPAPASPKKRRPLWLRILLAVLALALLCGALIEADELRRWHYRRSFARAAADASHCVLGPPSKDGEDDARDAIDRVQVGYLLTPTDPARPWPARCRPQVERALDEFDRAKKAGMSWADESFDRTAILDALARGDLNAAQAFLVRIWGSGESPDPSVPQAPERARAAISARNARPFLTGAFLPTSQRLERGDLHLVFEGGIDCALSANGKGSCERPPREDFVPIERELGARKGWLRTFIGVSGAAVLNGSGEKTAELPERKSIVWARSLLDGRILLATQFDEFFESKDGKTTPLPFNPDAGNPFRWAMFVDRWIVFGGTEAIEAVDLGRPPLVRKKIGPSTAKAERLARPQRSCVADATYFAPGKMDPALMILSKGEWQYVALEQPTLGRYVWCDGEAAVITDWMPLAIERCLETNCEPLPTAPVSAKSNDEFAADRTHVWQLERWNNLFTVRVWPIAEPARAKRVALVESKELENSASYARSEPTLNVVKDRAYLVFERKLTRDPIVITVDSDANARVVVAGE